MEKVLIVPPSGNTSFISLTQECSKQFVVWTLLNTLFSTVEDIVERPVVPYTLRSVGDGESPITLYERMSLELQHYKNTDEHFGVDFWTVCSGSRCYGTYTPIVRWFRGVLSVHFTVPNQPLAEGRILYVTF